MCYLLRKTCLQCIKLHKISVKYVHCGHSAVIISSGQTWDCPNAWQLLSLIAIHNRSLAPNQQNIDFLTGSYSSRIWSTGQKIKNDNRKNCVRIECVISIFYSFVLKIYQCKEVGVLDLTTGSRIRGSRWVWPFWSLTVSLDRTISGPNLGSFIEGTRWCCSLGLSDLYGDKVNLYFPSTQKILIKGCSKSHISPVTTTNKLWSKEERLPY